MNIISKIIGLDSGTRTRAIISLVTAITDFLAVFGVIKFSDEQIESIKNLILVIVSALVWGIGFWYNENYTPEMCEATGKGRLMKQKKPTDEEDDIGGAALESTFDEEL